MQPVTTNALAMGRTMTTAQRDTLASANDILKTSTISASTWRPEKTFGSATTSELAMGRHMTSAQFGIMAQSTMAKKSTNAKGAEKSAAEHKSPRKHDTLLLDRTLSMESTGEESRNSTQRSTQSGQPRIIRNEAQVLFAKASAAAEKKEAKVTDERKTREEEWLKRYPELADVPNAGPFCYRPTDLVNSSYVPIPVQPGGMPWSLQQQQVYTVLDKQREDAAEAHALYLETCRLVRQHMVETAGRHPDEQPRVPFDIGQLEQGIEELRDLQESDENAWVMNNETGFLERPSILETLHKVAGRFGKNKTFVEHYDSEADNAARIAAERDAEIRRPRAMDNAHIAYSVHKGCLGPGGDLFLCKMTVDEAKKKSRKLPGCRGFTFKSMDVNSTVPVMCYFKSHFKLQDGDIFPEWTSIRADWTEQMSMLDEALSIALPAYMTKTAGRASAGAVEL